VDEGRERQLLDMVLKTCPGVSMFDANCGSSSAIRDHRDVRLSSDIGSHGCTLRDSSITAWRPGAHGRPRRIHREACGRPCQGQTCNEIIKGKDGRIVSIVNKR